MMNYNFIKKGLIALLAFGAQFSFGQTTYLTVNSGAPTAGSNYQNFNDLVNYLNTTGVSGPTVVNVTPNSGPYFDKLHFENIPGSSATNTVRINGNGEQVYYQFGGISTSTNPYFMADGFILKMDGTKYLTVDNLKFKSEDTVTTSTYYYTVGASGALLTGGALKDSITNCTFELFKDTLNTYVYPYSRAGIVISGVSSSYYYGWSYYYGVGGAKHCYIANNLISDLSYYYAYFGISVFGGADSNTIAYNKLNNRSMYSFYIVGNKGNKILYNEITGENKPYYVGPKNIPSSYAQYGMLITDADSGTQIVGNRIHDPGSAPGLNYQFTGIWISNTYLSNAVAPPVLVANNAIYNLNYEGPIKGFDIGGRNIKFYHNTISIDKISSTFSDNIGIYISKDGADVRNNIVSITKGSKGKKWGLYYANLVDESQHNNVYVNSTQTGDQYYSFYFTKNYLSLNDFHTDFNYLEIGSPTVDPLFRNPAIGDLFVENNALKAAGDTMHSLVPQDILQNNRPVKPTIGAFESVLARNDMAAVEFITPKDSFCPSYQPVSISVVNTGVNDVDSFMIGWSIDGVVQPAFNYNKKLYSIAGVSGKYMDTVFLGNAYIPSLSQTIIRAWTYKPNGVTDTIPGNDEIVDTFEASAAVYTVTANIRTICPAFGAEVRVANYGNFPINAYSWEYSYDAQTWVGIPNSDTSNFRDINVPRSRWYRARIHTPTGICASDSLFIDVIVPEVLSIKGAGACDSGMLELKATTKQGTVLRWYDSLTATTPIGSGKTFKTPMLTQTKTYYVSSHINGLLGCESSRDSVAAIIEHALPNHRVWDTSFCPGPMVTITARDTGKSYQWNTFETSRSINVRDTGVYVVEITSKYGCVNYDSFHVQFDPQATVNGINFVPSFYPSLGTINFSPINPKNINSYFWEFGDGGTSTQMSPSHSYASSGNYYVSLTVQNPCREYTVSQHIHVDLTTGINDVGEAYVKLYPNPARDFVKVEVLGRVYEQIEIYDMAGRKVFETGQKNQNEWIVDTRSFSPGVYFIKLNNFEKNDCLLKRFEVRK